MGRISDESRVERKQRVLDLVKRRETGITTSEIAEVLNFKTRTVRDYLNELMDEYRVEREGKQWLPIPKQKLVKLEPTPEEVVVLYLAMRMFVKQSDRRNPLAQDVLLKMARLASNELHLGDDLEQAAAVMAQQPEDADYEDVFRQVVRAYLQRKMLRITYHPYHKEPFQTTIAPYLIEPSSFGYGTYAIGYSRTPDALRTYKLERIREARLTQEEFVVPKDFPGLDILRNAWSIFIGEAHVHVVLRFAPDVARRVKESNWRGINAVLQDDPDRVGYVRYSFDIADTTDLKPWIRTWGANAEVLEPADLRDEMIGEARALAHLYGWHTQSDRSNPHSRFNDIFGDA